MTIAEHPSATDACPKHMVHGPCGGVSADLLCELGDRRCSFVDEAVVTLQTPAQAGDDPPREATGGSEQGEEMRRLLEAGRVVVADFPAAALDADSIVATAGLLRDHVHAVLAGDSPRSRVQFPPTYRAGLIRAAGLRAWAGVNCRDRNRVALEGELAGLAHLGASGVLCLTGDHPALGDRPDAAAVFDLDSTQLATLARAAGLLTSVAESPASPPVAHRPVRLVEKVRAGAEICFVNHCGGAPTVQEFVTAVHTLGASPWFVACVPVVVDRASAQLLASFTSLVLPAGYLNRILGARDPREEGILAATELAEDLMGVDGIAGVNLSGGGGPGEELSFAAALAEIGARLGVTSAQPGR